MNIELKDRTENPIYVQVRQQIETHIRNKTLASGESLPTPAALGQKLSVDKGEIQRAELFDFPMQEHVAEKPVRSFPVDVTLVDVYEQLRLFPGHEFAQSGRRRTTAFGAHRHVVVAWG